MKKLKMFGFAFMAMFVGIMSTYAFSLKSDTNKVTATVSENERFAYSVIKVSKEDFSGKQTELEGYMNDYNTASSQLTTYSNEYPNDMTAYDKALAAYKASATNENKAALDSARTKLQTCVNAINKAKADMKTAVANMGSILNFDEFNPDNLKTLDTPNVPTEIISEAEMSTGDVYVVYVKNDCFSAFNSYGVIPFAAYQDGDKISDLKSPEIPALREDFPMPEEETTEPEGSQSTSTTDKKENVKNPKTGVSMPVALGIGVVALAGAGMFIVCKKQIFKQL